MDLDEIIYSWFTKYLKQRKTTKESELFERIELESIRSRLTLIARLLTGLPIEIYPADEEGGCKGNNYFLPRCISWFDTVEKNIGFYLYRLFYLSIQQGIPLSEKNEVVESEIAGSRNEAFKLSEKIFAEMEIQCPRVLELYRSLVNDMKMKGEVFYETHKHFLYGKLMGSMPVGAEEKQTKLATPSGKQRIPSIDPKSVLKAKAIEEIKSILVDQKAQGDYVLTHNFEKVETLEEFNGTWRDFDGDDDLSNHKDAIDELNMRLTVRTDDPVHSVLLADFIENTNIAEVETDEDLDHCIAYPEWNYAHKQYLEDLCRVYPRRITASDHSYYHQTVTDHRALLTGIRKALASFHNKWMQQKRKQYGSLLDYDALVDYYTDIHSGVSPSENIYIADRKIEKDLSIMILMDSSLSSDGYADGNRVIDIEKQVAILFGEILHEYYVEFAIASFNSSTRNCLRFETVKEFDERWEVAKYKVGMIQPNGYTRIGGALRHASNLLSLRPSANKWLLLLSDGKPNDYDKYEGKYGLHDVKQALRESREKRINDYALTVEAQARYYLPQMFGQNHYQILKSTADLVKAVIHLFEKIRFQSV